MEETVQPGAEAAVKSEAEYQAQRVRDILTERGEEITDASALETLAVLDAEHHFTQHMEPEEVDDFLDQFEGALADAEVKHEAIEDAADKASGGSAE